MAQEKIMKRETVFIVDNYDCTIVHCTHNTVKPKTTLIILTRNEITGVKAVLETIPFHAVDEYFAVDYDSHDGTVEYFRSHHVPVIKQKTEGRSEAFRLGVKHSHGDYLIFFSPDGNENPKDIPKLITLLKNGADMAIASRFMQGSRNEEDDAMIKPRKWANQGFTVLVNIFFGGRVTDSINGYRAITKSAWEKLHLDAKGFAIEFQMTMRALKLGYTIREIPTKEGDRIGGKSTSYALPTGLQFIGVLMREISIGKQFLKCR